MEAKIPESGYMENAKGHMIPVSMVSVIDRERDALVREISTITQDMSTGLSKMKRSIMDDIQAFVELSAEIYDRHLGGKKGNVTLHSFDGRFKVVFSVHDYTVFDERLQIAKSMIDECLREWSADSRPEIQAIVADAFQMDKKGRFNKDFAWWIWKHTYDLVSIVPRTARVAFCGSSISSVHSHTTVVTGQ